MLIILIGMLVVFYLMAPIYEFSEPKKFSGAKLYNPYQGMDSTQWKRYNFQVQSKAWGGLTEGRKNSNELIDSVYKAFGYDHVATSDYQKINYHNKDKASFIPTYEHGYNILKTHQVCIGAKKVLWVDLILFQTKSMKQWIIDQLAEECDIVVLAHPLLRNGYTIEDMKYLTNYRMMEVLNIMRISFDHWEMALSTGQIVWIMGNDDAHDVLHPNDVGRKFTMINSSSLVKDSIINKLEGGMAYAVDFFPLQDVPAVERIKKIKELPVITRVDLSGDTLFVSADQIVDAIHFVGQEGVIKSTAVNTKSAYYVIKPDDSYIRTEFKFKEATSIYLNPILRYDGDKPVSLRSAKVDAKATLWLRIVYFVVILGLVYFFRRKKLQIKDGNP